MGAAIDSLKKDHAAIERMLGVLDAVCRRLQAGDIVEPEHIRRIVEFLRAFADEYHHVKEEVVFFPALEQVGIPRQGGPVGVMLHEHEQMRRALQGMAGEIERLAAGEVGAAGDMLRYAAAYVMTLRPHIDKENSVLFRMAEMRLGPEREQELARLFEAIEADKLGEARLAEFHALLDRLEAAYVRGGPV